MILVTGPTGHIGNVLVRKLVERGEAVRVLMLPGEDSCPIEGLDVERIIGNVLDLDSLKKGMQGVDLVYHLAGLITIMPGKNELVRRVNVDGTINVLEAAQQMGVRRLVHTGSIHAFQRIPEGTFIDESVPFDPVHAINEYDRSKAMACLKVIEAAENGKIDALVACPTGVLGPHDYRGSEMGDLISDWATHQVNYLVNGAYDFVDVRDVADGMILTAEKGRSAQAYILSGEQIRVKQILETVREVLGGQKRLELNFPLGLARFLAKFMPPIYRATGLKPRLTPYSIETLAGNSTISSAKARRELGFSPRSVRESIRDSVAWWLERKRAALAR